MVGASEFNRLIHEAHRAKVGGLARVKRGYSRHGGDAECFQWGDVIFVTASHARGDTFFIYIIDGDNELFRVYGITGGNPGWTETYGWLHKGTWTKPILAYLRQLRKDVDAKKAADAEEARIKQSEANRAIGVKIASLNEKFRTIGVAN